MTDTSWPTLEIDSEVYLINGAIVDNPADIPEYSDYEIAKLNADGELLYSEKYESGQLSHWEAFAQDGDHLSAANTVLHHLINNVISPDTYGFYNNIELRVFIPSEHFELTVPLEEDEQYMAKAIYNTEVGVSDDGKTRWQTELGGYVIEVLITEPIMIRTKVVQYSPERELQLITYVLFAIDSHNSVSENYTFMEFSEDVIQEMEDSDDEPEEGRYIFPICDQAYLDEVANYIATDYVIHADFENNEIPLEEVQQHEELRRQWANGEQQPTMFELFLKHGIADTEIYNVPPEKQMQTLHAYLRQIHKHRQRVSTEGAATTHYVNIFEPVSTKSTELIPLEPGQTKRYKRICTYEGVTVQYECYVIDENNMPIKQVSFGEADEGYPMFEHRFIYDENGEIVDTQDINHLS